LNKAKRDLAGVLEIVVSVALFAVIAVLNFLLFTETAGANVLYRTIYGALSIVLDGTEIVLWLRGVSQRNALFCAIAISIAAIGLVSSGGAALLIATSQDAQQATAIAQQGDADARVKEAQDAVTVWQRRVDAVPAEFTTQLREVTRSLAAAQERLDAARDVRVASREEEGTRTAILGPRARSPMFDLLAHALHSSASVVKLVFLLAVSVLLQVSALATTYHNVRKETEVKDAHQKLYVDPQGVTHISNNGGGVICGKPMRYLEAPRPGVAYRTCEVCLKKGGTR
jgi:hypothetical protein